MNLPRRTAALVLVSALGLSACSGAEGARDTAESAATSLASPSADLVRETPSPERLANEAAGGPESADPNGATTEDAPAHGGSTEDPPAENARRPATPPAAAPQPAAAAPAAAQTAPQQGTTTAPQPAAPASKPPSSPASSPSSNPPPPAAEPPSQEPTRLLGFVGTREDPEAYEIGLTDASGRPVTSVPAGTYTFAISDRSTIHNFHLQGPGVSKATSVSQREEVTFTVELVPGTYSYVCDPHRSMSGSLTVTP